MGCDGLDPIQDPARNRNTIKSSYGVTLVRPIQPGI